MWISAQANRKIRYAQMWKNNSCPDRAHALSDAFTVLGMRFAGASAMGSGHGMIRVYMQEDKCAVVVTELQKLWIAQRTRANVVYIWFGNGFFARGFCNGVT